MNQSKRKGSDSQSVSLKACLFSYEQVTKSELIEKYLSQEKGANNKAMIGCIVKSIQFKSQNIKLNIWDIATQEKFLISSGLILKDCDIIMCLFDYSIPESFDFLKEKYTFIKSNSKPEAVFGLIGLNYQHNSGFNILHNDIMIFAAKLKAYFVATNIKLEMNVNDAFEKGIDLALSMRNIQGQKYEAVDEFQYNYAEVTIQDIAEVKQHLEATIKDLSNGLIGKIFGGDKEKIALHNKNLNIIRTYELSHMEIADLKGKNETLENAISSQYIKKGDDNKSEILELEKRLNDIILQYTKQLDNMELELRTSRVLCDTLKNEIVKLEEKNMTSGEGFKAVLQTYRAQNKEKIEIKDKIIRDHEIEREKLIEEIRRLKESTGCDKRQNENLEYQINQDSETQFLKSELEKRELEILELKKKLEEKEAIIK